MPIRREWSNTPLELKKVKTTRDGYRYVTSAEYFEELDAYCEDNCKVIEQEPDRMSDLELEYVQSLMQNPDQSIDDQSIEDFAENLQAHKRHPRSIQRRPEDALADLARAIQNPKPRLK